VRIRAGRNLRGVETQGIQKEKDGKQGPKASTLLVRQYYQIYIHPVVSLPLHYCNWKIRPSIHHPSTVATIIAQPLPAKEKEAVQYIIFHNELGSITQTKSKFQSPCTDRLSLKDLSFRLVSSHLISSHLTSSLLVSSHLPPLPFRFLPIYFLFSFPLSFRSRPPFSILVLLYPRLLSKYRERDAGRGKKTKK
jgi:hypothetical protein